MTSVDPATIAANVEVIRNRIADAGGDVDRVAIMAVTKAFGPEVVAAAAEAGLSLVGESYVQELVAKLALLEAHVSNAIEWQFIGRLQRNKVRQLPMAVQLIQSIDRNRLADEVAFRRPGQRVLVQVNIGYEAQKGGCAPDETSALVDHCRSLGLAVEGLMGVASNVEQRKVRAQYDLLSELADGCELTERSMGMTGDLEAAVRAGSTLVRVGTALFGPRSQR